MSVNHRIASVSRTTMRRLLLLVVVAVVVACGQQGGDPLAPSSLPPELEELPTVDVHADDFQQFSTVEELIEASDAVVKGTITRVSEGRFEAAPEIEDFAGDHNTEITLTIDAVIVGSGLAPGDAVTIEWSGYQVDASGNPTKLYVVNGVPFPTVGSEEVWFLKESEEPGWVVSDIDDGRFARSGGSVRALADTAGPAASDLEHLGVDGLKQLVAEGLDADLVFERGDTELEMAEGPGWTVLDFERGKAVGDHLASIVTTDRGLDRAWELGQFDTPQPEVSFADEVLILLTAGVSGSCPDIVFEELVIESDEVFGAFRYPSERGVCTSDFNPVTFFFVVDRQVLPDTFTLSVLRGFDNCEQCATQVDLDDEEAVEAELWGASTLSLATAGTPPPAGAFNVVQWAANGQVGALLFAADDWSEFPTWFQSLDPSFDVQRIDGFVASCPGDQCEECEGNACTNLPRLGEACSATYRPTLYEDQTFIVTFDGTSCSIDMRPGIFGRDP